MSIHLESATREIERLNKIARQFEDQVTRLTEELADMSANSDHFAEQLFLRTRERDELRELAWLYLAAGHHGFRDQEIQIGDKIAKLVGLDRDRPPTLDDTRKALANAEKETG